MSSDDYFDDSVQLTPAALAELDAIEVAHTNATQANLTQRTLPSSTPSISNHQKAPIAYYDAPRDAAHKDAIPSKLVIDVDADDSYDQFFDQIDPLELQKLDKNVETAYQHDLSNPRVNLASGSGLTRQLTLFGDPLPQDSSRPRATQRRSHPQPHRSPCQPFGKKACKVKKWDHTAFAKSGWKIGKAKAKENVMGCDEDAHDTMAEEFEQFPAPIPQKYSFGPPPPFKHVPDLLAAHTWIYPTNKPKRDYQFNIVKDSLFENSLVSLPTGLGKTFIAGVLMLNYYRWFPEGKVVFVAPTKPLVAQQIDACHQICGIPGGDAAELTGQTHRLLRAKAWVEKRVFFMTPQTFMNDLRTENCDPTDIVMLVIDEAHKATGNYAYAQLVRYLMATNAHFRVLGLTATPGSKPEAVQDIVDSLHISNVEIRDENSIDLRKYMLPKKISTHIVKMTSDVIKVRDMLAKLMEKISKRMCDTGLIPNLNVITLHPYRCSALMQQFAGDGTGKKFPWVYNDLKKLGALARAMGYLLECSIAMCHEELQGMLTVAKQGGGRSSGLHSEPLFQETIAELERQHNTCMSLHPKLDKLQSLAIDYFARAQEASGEARDPHTPADATDEAEAPGDQTKMMVFTNFRSSVDEIVELLNTHQPLVRATRFIGQGSDKHGRKGIAQKDQLEVIKRFKEGVYNVLVATCIGEEGLDIGEVDMIICYDAQKTPIRMLQRVGRTGRKRAGRVEVLLSEDREEANWDKAKRDYESVQSSIIRGESLELYADVDRLLPDHIKPKCLETAMAIEEYVRDTKPSKLTSAPKGSKRKRNADVMRNIPEGAVNGFVPSSKLIPKGDSRKRKAPSSDCDEDESNDDDGATKAGVRCLSPEMAIGKGKKCIKSTATSRKKTGKARLRGKQLTSSTPPELTLSQLDRELADNSDDIEIELGIKLSSPARPLADVGPSNGPAFPNLSSPVSMRSSLEPLSNMVNADEEVTSHSKPRKRSHSPVSYPWLDDSDDDDVKVLEDISYPVDPRRSSKVDRNRRATPQGMPTFRRSPLSHVPSANLPIQNSTLPLSIPAPTLSSSDGVPEPTFALRPPGVRRKRPRISSSPSLDRRSEMDRKTSPASPPLRSRIGSRRRRDPVKSRAAIGLLDLEAQVSGDETSMGGGSDCEDVASDSDRRFVEELPPTQQPSPGYDQTLAYRHSLLTQPPKASGGPRFTTKPARRRVFGPERQNALVNVSSSPPTDAAPDQYSMDSFVVEDDDDVLLHEESHSSSL